jgi:16S rRNA (uracil1498-N3)-methyltransferase
MNAHDAKMPPAVRTTRIYVDSALHPGQELLLPPGPSAHLLRVLRLRPGAELTLFNARGGEYAARLAGTAARGSARLTIGEHRAIERESQLELTLLQGIARGERMDLIVQKATELGVQRILPVRTEFSVVRLDAGKLQQRLAHWRAVAIAACEQCGRNRLPRLDPPLDLAAACAAAASGEGLRLLLLPESRDSLAALALGSRSVALLVGPEGGLSEGEERVALQAGFRACRLGPRVLRTETAPLAALAALQALAGDFAW